MGAVKGLNAILAQGQEIVGVRAVAQDGAHPFSLQRLGEDQGHRRFQVGVHPAETPDVDHHARPEPIQLAQDEHGEAPSVAMVLAVGIAPQLEVQFLVGGQKSGLTISSPQATGDGYQVDGVGFALAAFILQLALALAEQGVDKAVVERGRGVPVPVGCIACHQRPCPGFVVDAGRLVAQHNPSIEPTG